MFTDKTIEINCAECDKMETGVDAMMAHILDTHREYTAAEAANHARLWADDAYEVQEKQLSDYHDEKKIDRAIEADMNHQRHGI